MIQLKKAKNNCGYFWTQHALYKMNQYGLSEQRIRRVLRNPFRREEGIVKNTIAVMQPVSVKKINNKETWKQEIWAMYQNDFKSKKLKVKSGIGNLKANRLKIISAWRYPGVSPKNNPIPEEIIREIGQFD